MRMSERPVDREFKSHQPHVFSLMLFLKIVHVFVPHQEILNYRMRFNSRSKRKNECLTLF